MGERLYAGIQGQANNLLEKVKMNNHLINACSEGPED